MSNEVELLKNAIRKHRDQKADDRCVFDDEELYSVLNEPIPCDRRVGSKEEMLKNCKRFIETRCEQGGWKTYQELEQENKELKLEVKRLKGVRQCV